MKTSILLLTGSLAVALSAFAGSPLKIELPPETQSFKPAAGSEIANGRCLTCHSVEYVVTQPPFPLTFWDSEVKKMRDKYGATLPDEQIQTLVNYLTANYGVGPATAPATAPPPAVAPATPSNGEALASLYGCLACHNVKAKIGPAYKDVAAKYRNDRNAYEKISEQIHKGGSGKWGPVLMPPFPMVTEEQTKALAAWILSQN